MCLKIPQMSLWKLFMFHRLDALQSERWFLIIRTKKNKGSILLTFHCSSVNFCVCKCMLWTISWEPTLTASARMLPCLKPGPDPSRFCTLSENSKMNLTGKPKEESLKQSSERPPKAFAKLMDRVEELMSS